MISRRRTDTKINTQIKHELLFLSTKHNKTVNSTQTKQQESPCIL